MNQNVHAINTTILQYAKQENRMKGKAFENKAILKQMEHKTKKLESWLIVCFEKHGKQMRWRHAPLVLYKHFFFWFSITWFRGACLSSRMSEFNLRHVWKTHVLHASSWIAGHVSEFDFHKPPPRISDHLRGLVLGCFHCIIIANNCSVRSGIMCTPKQLCIISFALKCIV